MKAWHVAVYLLLTVCALNQHTAFSCGCYGPNSTPDPRRCACRLLKDDEVIHYYTEFTTSAPVFTVDTPQPQFTVHPRGGTYIIEQKLTLSCNVSYGTTSSDQSAPIRWEHNGTAVPPLSNVDSGSSIEQSGSLVYYSTLTIPHFSASAQGDYECQVDNGNSNYTIVSTTATLQLPKFLGWIDTVYQNQSHSDTVTVTVQKGGSVVLECSPNTTESLESLLPTWLHLNKTASVLPSGSVLLTSVQEETQLSCVWALRQSVTRQFTVKLKAADQLTTQEVKLVVIPEDKVVATGSRVDLYCISEGGMPLVGIHWLRDGQPVEDVAIIGDSRVLEIHKATVGTAGNYTCTASDDSSSVSASAVITVVEPPLSASLSVSGSGVFMRDSDAILPMDTTNASLSLHCLVENPHTIHYQWLFRGEVIESGYEKATLIVTMLDPLNVIGSYQCFASNIAGQAQATMRVMQANPAPPTNVNIRKNPSEYFRYDITWTQPNNTGLGYTVFNYTVQTLAMRDHRTANFCSCISWPGATETVFPFLAGCPGSSFTPDYTLYYRVAANTDVGQSPFAHGSETGVQPGAPPEATGLRTLSTKKNEATHMWDVTLDWNYQDTAAYSPSCYDTHVSIMSGGNSTSRQSDKPFKGSVNCCTEYTWTVANINLVTSNTTGKNSTEALRPSKPPQFVSLERSGTTGTVILISYKLPADPAVSCTCGLQSISATVRYANATSTQQTSISLPLFTTSFSITLPNTHGWAPYNISLAFNNSAGMSGFSEALPLQGPTDSDHIPSFSKQLWTTTASENVSVHYELEDGASALLSDGVLKAHICYKRASTQDDCSATTDESDMNCSSINSEEGSISLPRYHDYCIVAVISSNVSDFNFEDSSSLKVSANERSPTSKPEHLIVEAVNSSLFIQWELPPFDAWNGIPQSFRLNVSENGTLVLSIAVPSNDSHYQYSSYKNGANYNITVSACTRVGCGPFTTKSFIVPSQQGGSSQSSGESTVVLASSVTSGVAVLSLAVVAVAAIVTLCCCHRKRKKNNYDQLSESENEYPAMFREDESLDWNREPPTGSQAHSVYTDIESLDPDRDRTAEWVKDHVHSRRDEYLKQVDEELEHVDNKADVSPQSTGTAAALSATTTPPVLPVMMMQGMSSGYCTEADALVHSAKKTGTSTSAGKTSETSSNSATNSRKSPSATASSSGYSTEQSFTRQKTVPSLPFFTPEKTAHLNISQAAAVIHNDAQYHSTDYTTNRMHPTDGCQAQSSTDFMSSLMCDEEFSNQGECNNTVTSFNPPPLVTQRHKLPPVLTTSSYIDSSRNSQSHISSLPVNRTVETTRPAKPAEGEEDGDSDSVFDSSVSPPSPPRAESRQHKTRSTATSGFVSSSDSRHCDSVHSGNVEMSSFGESHPPSLALSSTANCRLPVGMASTAMHSPPLLRGSSVTASSSNYVVPSILDRPQTRTSHSQRKPEAMGTYMNLQDTLVTNISFDIRT